MVISEDRKAEFKKFYEIVAKLVGSSDREGISPSAFSAASMFMHLLPEYIRIPDIYVDPDGEITFEWYFEPRRVFAVIATSEYDLAYAGLFGTEKVYGRKRFVNKIPKVILDNITRVVLND